MILNIRLEDEDLVFFVYFFTWLVPILTVSFGQIADCTYVKLVLCYIKNLTMLFRVNSVEIWE